MEEFLHYILTTNISTVVEQAIAGDQVVYRMATRNNILLQWAILTDSEKYYIDLLNDIIPGTVVRIILN